ncbi:HvfC/BufC family peptide modification chaperone [Lysobacter brunescens]|uniref:DNA-binding domain-containing protein n=1 Tax=Lysobacter brunescens TaxID=262323 RepID=A0ABW2Y8U9_9GAMM
MSLSAQQAWLWQAILAGGAQDADATVHAGTLPPQARLGIYAGGYRLRLLECMRATFPLLQAALGDRLFDAFALDYIAAHPSRSHTLHALGTGFATHLAATRPARSDADDGDWADFMIALATFERALCEVYDGPGDEHREEGGEDDTLAPARSLRLLTLSHPVHECLRRHHTGQPIEAMPARTTHLALARVAYRVVVEAINPVEHAIFTRILQDGLAAGLADVRAGAGDEGLALWLQRQQRRGLLVGRRG